LTSLLITVILIIVSREGGQMLRKGLTIYEPRGRAGEYAPLAVNLYNGCGHGCTYCYAPDATFQDRKEFYTGQPRPNIIEKLMKDAPKAAADGAKGNVLLCFTCDPYQPINDIHQLTRRAILILHSHCFNVTILTKGGRRAEADFDLLLPGDEFATTLTFWDSQKSLQWEPYAATPVERIQSLKIAHSRSIRTWVSLEPVIEPKETLELIRMTHTFVDLFKVGTLNNHPHASKIDWPKFANDATNLLEELDCRFYLKKDLRRYL